MKSQNLLNKLQQLAIDNEEYRQFNARVVNDPSVEFIGVRVPDLRKMAKEIAGNDWRLFLLDNTWQAHEEKMLACLLPQYIRPRFVLTELFSYFDEVASHLSSWAQTDTLATRYPQIQTNKVESYKKVVSYALSDNLWIVRLGIVLLMNNFLDDEYIQGVLILVKNIETDEYYVKMAVAWLLAEASIKYRDRVEKVLTQVDPEIARYAKQKMRDSRRVS